MQNLIKIFSFLALCSCVVFMSFVDHDRAAESVLVASIDDAFRYPDLSISAIATPGGLCKGTRNRVRVTITNSQQYGTSKVIPVEIKIIQPPYQPITVRSKLKNGIGPNANNGQVVWFNNVPIAGTTPLQIKGWVNKSKQVRETNYNNNRKTLKVNHISSSCSSS